MKHEDFRHAAIGQAFDAIEERILPSLRTLVERAAAAEAGTSAAPTADELRQLARELEELEQLIGLSSPPLSRPR